MNIEELKSLVRFARESELLTALLEGKEIEYIEASASHKWVPIACLGFTEDECLFDMFANPETYRIKPEPRRVWEVADPNGHHILFSANGVWVNQHKAAHPTHIITSFTQDKEAK